MPLRQEDRDKYAAFVQDQVNLLEILHVNDEDILWHYT
jgi:hypothetical protein